MRCKQSVTSALSPVHTDDYSRRIWRLSQSPFQCGQGFTVQVQPQRQVGGSVLQLSYTARRTYAVRSAFLAIDTVYTVVRFPVITT